MVGTVLGLLLTFLFLLPLFPFVVVTLSFLVFLLMGLTGLLARGQILGDAVVVLVLLVLLFVLPGWGRVENAVFFGQLKGKVS